MSPDFETLESVSNILLDWCPEKLFDDAKKELGGNVSGLCRPSIRIGNTTGFKSITSYTSGRLILMRFGPLTYSPEMFTRALNEWVFPFLKKKFPEELLQLLQTSGFMKLHNWIFNKSLARDGLGRDEFRQQLGVGSRNFIADGDHGYVFTFMILEPDSGIASISYGRATADAVKEMFLNYDALRATGMYKVATCATALVRVPKEFLKPAETLAKLAVMRAVNKTRGVNVREPQSIDFANICHITEMVPVKIDGHIDYFGQTICEELQDLLVPAGCTITTENFFFPIDDEATEDEATDDEDEIGALPSAIVSSVVIEKNNCAESPGCLRCGNRKVRCLHCRDYRS